MSRARCCGVTGGGAGQASLGLPIATAAFMQIRESAGQNGRHSADCGLGDQSSSSSRSSSPRPSSSSRSPRRPPSSSSSRSPRRPRSSSSSSPRKRSPRRSARPCESRSTICQKNALSGVTSVVSDGGCRQCDAAQQRESQNGLQTSSCRTPRSLCSPSVAASRLRFVPQVYSERAERLSCQPVRTRVLTMPFRS